MEIHQLKGFYAVAKYLNFTQAAQKTNRTQPTISLQIKSLEDELGVKLFERLGPKKVSLTKEGELFLEIITPLLHEFSAIQSKFNETRSLFHTSSLNIVTHSSVMIYLLPPVIKKFKALYPQVKLLILNRPRKEIIKMVQNSEVDMGISSLDSIPQELDYQIFSRYNRVLIAHKDNLISKKKNITLEDISNYPLVLPNIDSNTRKMIDRAFSEANLSYELTMEVVGRSAIKAYVEMDLGISIINEYYISEEDRNKLFIKNMSTYFGIAETGLIVKKNRPKGKPLEIFMKLVKDEMSNL